jgi:hypothetical protein
MEFLLLAVIGLATLGAKEVLAPEEKDESDSKEEEEDSDEKADEPQKTPEQELMEAIAKYESHIHKDKKIKFHYEIEDK